MRVRPATAGDYPAFSRLFPELAVGDPTPDEVKWRGDLVPTTLVAEEEGEVVGYLFYQALSDTGYIRHVVASPARRRAGVGRALVEEARRRFVAAGARRWCLNVKPENTAAIGLYESVGMSFQHASTALFWPWVAGAALPQSPSVVARRAEPSDDAEVERELALAPGLCADFRARAGRVLFVAHDAGRVAGLAIYDTHFDGALPFAAREPAVARALFEVMLPHRTSGASEVQLVVENDARLTSALVDRGARVKLAFCHYAGDLRFPVSSST